MVENICYDPDCNDKNCYNPKHYNHICFDPKCDNIHCTDSNHYNKELLKDYQKNIDFKTYEHREKIDYDEDVKISICGCPDCADEDEHHKHHKENHNCNEHNHKHHKENHNCNEHNHKHHNHEDDVEISICGCPDCADEDENHDNNELISEGKPLVSNRPIQIILASGVLFALGHILEFLSINPNIVTTIFLLTAIIAGYEIAKLAYNSLIKRHTIGPAMLVCIACVASFIIGHPEEGAAVTFLYYIAEFLEDYVEHRAKRSIKSLIEIAPETARIKNNDKEELKKVDEVNIGEIVIVKPGDKIPLDGKVTSGTTTINQASITGESIPVIKEVGDEVFSGTVNEDGYIEIVVTKKAKDSVISKIVTLVKRSQLNRSETETLVEKISKYYTPIMMVAATGVAFIPPLFFGQNLVDWVYRALSLLVISCPCAFLISTPVGMVSSITSATKNGVLIKGSSYVEEMKNVKAVIFDKTGTLTEGKLELSGIEIFDDDYTKEDVLKIAASLENQSTHPIAKAILNYTNQNNIKFEEIQNFKNIPGKGIIGDINGEQYYAANESLIEDSAFDISPNEINKFSSNGETIVFIGNSKKTLGIIKVSDKIRNNAKKVVKDLKEKDIKTVILTGDNKIAGKSVADKIGIDYVYSNLLPEDKLDILDSIRNKFGAVVMVGDGINDAPALARANIGIAMGAAGSDVAIETSDIALMQDDISKLPYLFSLSHKTMQIIKQNIVLAIIVKLLCVILSILGIITLMMSVGFGDLGLTLFVILNSLRIGIVKDPLF